MESANWIGVAAVAVAFIAVIIQQRQFWHQQQQEWKQENRVANKLKIFQTCKEAQREEEIFGAFKSSNPPLEKIEIQKLIYEMLAERTLVFNADTRTYEAASHNLRSSQSSELQKQEEQDRIRQQMQQQQK